MIPYLQKLIDKYRVPVPFSEYMSRGNRKCQRRVGERQEFVLLPLKELMGGKWLEQIVTFRYNLRGNHR